MIELKVIIEENEGGINLKMLGDSGTNGATDAECEFAAILQPKIYDFLTNEMNMPGLGDAEIVAPYISIQETIRKEDSNGRR